jgi:hypothetical protein
VFDTGDAVELVCAPVVAVAPGEGVAPAAAGAPGIGWKNTTMSNPGLLDGQAPDAAGAVDAVDAALVPAPG